MDKLFLEYWAEILTKKYNFSRSDLLFMNNELGSLGRAWDGHDVFQIMENMGSEEAKSILFESKLRKADLYRFDYDKVQQRAGEELRRIAVLGKTKERTGD